MLHAAVDPECVSEMIRKKAALSGFCNISSTLRCISATSPHTPFLSDSWFCARASSSVNLLRPGLFSHSTESHRRAELLGNFCLYSRKVVPSFLPLRVCLVNVNETY